MTFSYDVLCDAAVASFNFSVNGVDVPLPHGCARAADAAGGAGGAHHSFSAALPIGCGLSI